MTSRSDNKDDDDLTEADKAIVGLYRKSQKPIDWDESDEAILAMARSVDRPSQSADAQAASQDEAEEPSIVPFRRRQENQRRQEFRAPLAGLAIAASLLVGLLAGQALTPYFSIGVGPDYAGLQEDNDRLAREVARFSDWKSPEDYLQVLDENRRLQSEIDAVKQFTGSPGSEDIGQPLEPSADLNELSALIDGFSCASLNLRFASGGGIVVGGFVSGQSDLTRLSNELAALSGATSISNRATIVDRPFCGFLEALSKNTDLGSSFPGAPQVALLDRGAEGSDGAGLSVAATATGTYDGYLYVDAIGQDGRVLHLASSATASSTPLLAGRQVLLPLRERSLPSGKALLLVVSTPEPLFAEAGPAEEEADTYLARLAPALQRLAGRGASNYSLVEFDWAE